MGMRVNKYDAIAIVTLGVRFLDADEVVVSLDSHMTSNPLNPKTGEPWGPNEMQNLCNDEGACDTGIITDAITTIRIGPDRPSAMISRKYHVNHEKREVHWVDPYDCMVDGAQAGNSLGGFMVDSFLAAWDADVMALPAPAKPDGMSDDEAQAHRSVVGFRLMAEVVGGAAMPLEKLDDPEVAAVYEEYLTEEYVERDMNGAMGLLVPLLRRRFGLDEDMANA